MLHHHIEGTLETLEDGAPASVALDSELADFLNDIVNEDPTDSLPESMSNCKPSHMNYGVERPASTLQDLDPSHSCQGLRLACIDTDSETMSEVSKASPRISKPRARELNLIELRYGKNRLAPGFKKFSRAANTDLFRVTFKCGLDCSGEPCEHRIGLFHTIYDDVLPMADGEYLYNGRRLGWGNLIPAIDQRTRGKLAQTWRAHFASKHGWDKRSDNLPVECRLMR